MKFALRRLLAIPVTLVLVTAVLYAIIMLAPAEERAMLYWPPNTRNDLPTHIAEAKIQQIIAENGLNDPFLQQYWRWASGLMRGDWGFSPVVNDEVLNVLLNRTPVTAELTLYSILFLIPLGLVSGVLAGFKFQKDGFIIAFLADDTIVVGDLHGAAIGMEYEFEGEWDEHPRFGAQFRFSSARSILPTDTKAIRQYLRENCRWVGPAISSSLIDAYGGEALRPKTSAEGGRTARESARFPVLPS